jgi:glycolate oxidase FAD binding subunit
VKNVTGYDMCKLLAGSWGTLAAMTDVTIKVLPKAESEATVIVEGLDDARACAAMAAAMGSSCDVSGAAHLPDHVASYFDGLPRPEAATALRLEGFTPSVKHRKEALTALMKPFGPVALLDEKESRALWRSVRQVKPFAAEAARARPLWRISTAPSRGHEIAAAITPAAQMFYDWAGGLLWVAMPFADEPDAGSIRTAVNSVGGHATLVRAPAPVRASVEVFEPQEAALRALAKRVKESFDPKGVLNPGRMYAGV